MILDAGWTFLAVAYHYYSHNLRENWLVPFLRNQYLVSISLGSLSIHHNLGKNIDALGKFIEVV